MFIWTGCKLPEDYEHEIRSHCLALNETIGLDTASFTLPQHISLKISFEIPDEQGDEILGFIKNILTAQPPFSVNILGAEQRGPILWLKIAENEHLQQLHELLDRELSQRFRVPQHEFDKCFKFHSTLFMDQDQNKISQMAAALDGYPFSRQLHIDTFVQGVSPIGRIGTYRVVGQIKV